ncbi:hypothetical protein B0H13DRAFT_2677777 [Mycena leptocephala]|nr:hypothetical protein B0H13DRAFT_2677777 [Mycena leptocephala]
MTRKRLSIPLQSSHLHGSKSSSCTAGVGVDVFESPTRPPRVSLLQRRFEMLQLRCICIFAPHPFCVAKNPRLIAYSIVLFGFVLNGIHEMHYRHRPYSPAPRVRWSPAPLLLAPQELMYPSSSYREVEARTRIDSSHFDAPARLVSRHRYTTPVRSDVPAHSPRRSVVIPSPALCAPRAPGCFLRIILPETACSLRMLPASIDAFCSPLVGAVTSISASTVVFYSASPHPVLFHAPRSALRVAVSPLRGGEPHEDSPLSPPTASPDYSNRCPFSPYSLESHSSAPA